MSAGIFTRSFYQTNAGNICKARVQPETLSALLGGSANAGATPPATSGFPSILISRSRRSNGIHPRTVTIAFSPGIAPAGYKPDQTYVIPVMTSALWDGIEAGDAVTYLSTAGEVVSKTDEAIV